MWSFVLMDSQPLKIKSRSADIPTASTNWSQSVINQRRKVKRRGHGVGRLDMVGALVNRGGSWEFSNSWGWGCRHRVAGRHRACL